MPTFETLKYCAAGNVAPREMLLSFCEPGNARHVAPPLRAHLVAPSAFMYTISVLVRMEDGLWNHNLEVIRSDQ
jgi:hypothetical protein